MPATSINGEIGLTLLGDIEAITFTGTAPSVKLRKQLAIQMADTFPLIIIAPLAEMDTGDDEFEMVCRIQYPWAIGIAIDANEALDGDSQQLMFEYREKIRRVVRRVTAVVPITSPTTVERVSMNFDPPFDPPALRDNLDWSAMVVTYEVKEPQDV